MQVLVVIVALGGIEIAEWQRTDHLHLSDRGVRLAAGLCEHVARGLVCTATIARILIL